MDSDVVKYYEALCESKKGIFLAVDEARVRRAMWERKVDRSAAKAVKIAAKVEMEMILRVTFRENGGASPLWKHELWSFESMFAEFKIAGKDRILPSFTFKAETDWRLMNIFFY